MKIYIDADALPRELLDLICRCALREKVETFFVANSFLRIPCGEFIKFRLASKGFNAADDLIADSAGASDLVVTADIPLADRVVSSGAIALNPRGEVYHAANIKQALAMRNLLDELRVSGEIAGGPAPYNAKAKERFTNELNKIVTRIRLAEQRRKQSVSLPPAPDHDNGKSGEQESVVKGKEERTKSS